MSIGADTAKNNATETVKAAQDAVRRYTDESVAASRTYMATFTATAQASLRTAFDLQNASIQATRGILDAMIQANNKWLDQSMDAIRKSQEVGSKVAGSTLDMIESSMPSIRG